MNKYLKNLNRIEFVVTMACTGRCKHCSQGQHKKGESIDGKIAAEAVKRIADEYKIDSVMTFGGEPLLCVDTVCEIHKSATEKGIRKRQLITNGFFSKDTERIKEVAKLLSQSGINEILLSVDAFHQETIPLDTVKGFAIAVLETGTLIKVQPAWLVNKDNENPYNNQTKELLKEFAHMGIEENEGNIIFPAGNALKFLGEYFPKDIKYKNPYDEDPADLRAICFGSNGEILGSNIYEKDIMKIISDYKPKLTDRVKKIIKK